MGYLRKSPQEPCSAGQHFLKENVGQGPVIDFLMKINNLYPSVIYYRHDEIDHLWVISFCYDAALPKAYLMLRLPGIELEGYFYAKGVQIKAFALEELLCFSGGLC